jgi:4-amino-4-deoxy-L-arabinose transferase-like glycosyltransferase
MKRPVEILLAVLCMVSIYRPFSGDANVLEYVGYFAMAALSILLILVLHLRPNDHAQWGFSEQKVLRVRPRAGTLAKK